MTRLEAIEDKVTEISQYANEALTSTFSESLHAEIGEFQSGQLAGRLRDIANIATTLLANLEALKKGKGII